MNVRIEGERPPAAMFFYSPDRKGERPVAHLKRLQRRAPCRRLCRFNGLYEGGRIIRAACWAHVRRKFSDVHIANDSAIAKEALDRIGTPAPSRVGPWSPPKKYIFNVGGAVRDAQRHAARGRGIWRRAANRQPNKVSTLFCSVLRHLASPWEHG